ncbi:hypothetical protein SSP35_07_02780 [Streptomyces sp. NBRC 110611]|nr:hypothetical protein SSP35_07_02780 [Streptomyces sp. NBRC 110611]
MPAYVWTGDVPWVLHIIRETARTGRARADAVRGEVIGDHGRTAMESGKPVRRRHIDTESVRSGGDSVVPSQRPHAQRWQGDPPAVPAARAGGGPGPDGRDGERYRQADTAVRAPTGSGRARVLRRRRIHIRLNEASPGRWRPVSAFPGDSPDFFADSTSHPLSDRRTEPYHA